METELLSACRVGYASQIHDCLGVGIDVAQLCDNEGNTPLHLLAMNGVKMDSNVVARLCELGVDPARKNHLRQTPRDVAETLAEIDPDLHAHNMAVLSANAHPSVYFSLPREETL